MIAIDKFLERQFNPYFSGTSLYIPADIGIEDLNTYYYNLFNNMYDAAKECNNDDNAKIVDCPIPGMEFCKYLIFKNHLPINRGTIPYAEELIPRIRSEYEQRRPDELPILTRFVYREDLNEIPMANYLVCILYSKEQLKLEYIDRGDSFEDFDKIYTDNIEYGCICVLGTENDYADPMTPITMMRNALGKEEGGNGAKLNHDEYMKSVEFWKNNILMR